MSKNKVIYCIRIEYITGDSFHSEETSEVLDYDWTNINIVKQNVERIKNHYNVAKEHYSSTKPKNLPVGAVWEPQFRMILLELLTNKKEKMKVSASWCGYFEHLQAVSIVLKDELYRIDF